MPVAREHRRKWVHGTYRQIIHHCGFYPRATVIDGMNNDSIVKLSYTTVPFVVQYQWENCASADTIASGITYPFDAARARENQFELDGDGKRSCLRTIMALTEMYVDIACAWPHMLLCWIRIAVQCMKRREKRRGEGHKEVGMETTSYTIDVFLPRTNVMTNRLLQIIPCCGTCGDKRILSSTWTWMYGRLEIWSMLLYTCWGE